MTRIVAVVLIVFGLMAAGVAIDRTGQPPPAIEGTLAPSDRPGTLSLVVLPLVAGASLSAGVILFGIGMGRWRRPRTRPAPGDAVVDPAAHHKMDHV